MSTHFGPFELNEQTRELRRDGEPVVLQPRVFDVLEYLVRHRQRMVGKEELLNTLWPDVIVTDASLQRAISLIRAALRPGGWAEAVQTRARLGYRFALEEAAAGPPKPSPDSTPPATGADSPLLEREQFQEELGRRFRLARAGQGQAVFLCGEPGIGKSALVSAFLAGMETGVTVLRGYCDALFTPRAFGAILDVASQLPGQEASIDTALPREQLFGELHRRLQAFDRGAIVLLEDLHWADEATLDFVRFLARRIARTHCLLLATYRDEEGGAKRLLNQTLGDLASPQVSRQRLLPLTPAAVGQLAREAGQEGARIFGLTGGNPFLVRELLSSPASGVPETVRDSMLARLARCSAPARQVCEVVALLPGRAEFELLAPVLGEVAEAVDEAVARGIILQENSALAYRHELARRAVENILPPSQSRALHARILTALRARHADVARLVHHARCAGDRTAVLALAPEAAKRAAAVGAHREAAAQYAAALAFADELPPRDRIALLEGHAYECYLTSQIATAVESAATALALWRKLGDRAAEGRTLRFLSRQHWFLGDREKAERFATEAIAVLEALPPGRDLAMAYSNRSQLEMLKGAAAETIEYGTKAVALARSLGDLEVESHALNNIGTVKLTVGDMTGAADLERSLQLARAQDLHEHMARAYVNLSTSMRRHQEIAATRRHFQEGLAYCEERDLDAWTNYLRGAKTLFDLDRGEWDAAVAAAGHLLRDATITAITRIPALVALALVRLRRGEPGGQELLDEALALALPTKEVQRVGPVAAARAEAAWLRGDIPAVVREADRGLEWALTFREFWLAGTLLFWKSRAARLKEVPDGLSAAYRFSLAGDWKAAAAEFAERELPYERALILAQGDRKAVALSREILGRLGAKKTLERLGT